MNTMDPIALIERELAARKNKIVEGVFIPWGCIKLFFARKHRSFGVYYNAARLRLYINYSIRHAGESDYRNEQQTSERDDDTAERLYA